MAVSISESDELKSDINVTPLVDVMLVLLVIFMVVTPLLKQQVPVELPLAEHSSESEETSQITLTAAADGTVRASSPRGQVVLRAELERGVGLPTAATLRSGFLGGLRRLRGRSESVVEAPGFVAMRFVLFDPDGGAGEPEALLSATALGEDTLLCSSLRGATPAELTVILAACQSARSAGR